jgi:hypothetical protein
MAVIPTTYFDNLASKSRTQRKNLSTALKAVTNDIADLRFTGLIVGKRYRLITNVSSQLIAGAQSLLINTYNSIDTSAPVSMVLPASDNAGVDRFSACEVVTFIAVSNYLRTDLTVILPVDVNSYIEASSGGSTGTYLVLEELNDYVDTTTLG